MSQEILNVEGMSCGHCKSAVESALNNIDGVVINTKLKNRTDENPNNPNYLISSIFNLLVT